MGLIIKLNMLSFLRIIQHPIVKIILSYTVCILAHFTASHMYIQFCVPNTLSGLLLSPFMTLTPHCQAFRWLIYYGGNAINILWLIVANFLVSKITNYFTEMHAK